VRRVHECTVFRIRERITFEPIRTAGRIGCGVGLGRIDEGIARGIGFSAQTSRRAAAAAQSATRGQLASRPGGAFRVVVATQVGDLDVRSLGTADCEGCHDQDQRSDPIAMK
jgi:hypothetical protein